MDAPKIKPIIIVTAFACLMDSSINENAIAAKKIPPARAAKSPFIREGYFTHIATIVPKTNADATIIDMKTLLTKEGVMDSMISVIVK